MLVTRVAVVAGYVSYLHIVDVATRVGERPEVAYALPVTIDALMVMSTLAMLADRRAGRRPSAWAHAGFLFGVAVSVTSNVASAAPTWPARGVAAIPAVSLLLAVEVLVRAGRAHTRTDTDRPPEADTPTADMPRPPADTTTDVRPRTSAPHRATRRTSERASKPARKRTSRRSSAPAVLEQRPDITATELVQLTGISDRHARRLVNGNHNRSDADATDDVRHPDTP